METAAVQHLQNQQAAGEAGQKTGRLKQREAFSGRDGQQKNQQRRERVEHRSVDRRNRALGGEQEEAHKPGADEAEQRQLNPVAPGRRQHRPDALHSGAGGQHDRPGNAEPEHAERGGVDSPLPDQQPPDRKQRPPCEDADRRPEEPFTQ